MNEEDRLELEQELLLTCSKAQAINKYIDELEENTILTNQWYKSQQESKQLKDNWNKLKAWIKSSDEHYPEAIPFRETLRAMQELESGDSNE